MNWDTNFGYDDIPEAQDPPVGSIQVLKVFKADFKELDDGRGLISLFGGFPEFSEDSKWNGAIWLPNAAERTTDPDRYQKSVKNWLGGLRAFGADDPRGKHPAAIAEGLVGHFGQGKVDEDEYGLKAKFFKRLSKDQAQRFKQPPAPQGTGTAHGAGQRSAPQGFGAGRGGQGASAFGGFGKRSV